MFVLPFDGMQLVSKQGPRPRLRSTGRILSIVEAQLQPADAVDWHWHQGTDWTRHGGNTEGTPLRASLDADVLWADDRGGVSPFTGYGNAVVLRYAPELLSLYGHCRDVLCVTGQRIAAGTDVATIGRSSTPGHSVGLPHLHWELVTRWPLRSDQIEQRYDVEASLAAAGYRLNDAGRPVYIGPRSAFAEPPRAPAPPQSAGDIGWILVALAALRARRA